MAFLRPDDDDDDFVIASGKSKLNALFGGPSNESSDVLSGRGKQAQPQAAPRRADDASQQKERAGPSEVFNACAVTAFRFSSADNRYQPAGQCGMALVGNLQAKDFKLVLYVSKQQQLGFAIVNGTFQFNVAANNYATFYDSANTLWSVMFDSSKSITEFCKFILLCRAACSNFATLLTQDISSASGEADKEQSASVDVDDQIEVRYTAWLVDAFAAQPASLVKTVLDDNTAGVKGLRFRVGQQKVVRGLEEGVIGMRRVRGTKRLVFVPASSTNGMLASASTRAPPNTALLFSVELSRVRDDAAQAEDRNRAQSIIPLPAIPGADIPNQPQSPQQSQSASAPVTVASGDADEEPFNNKAKLLNRMAKMGQAVLPTQQRGDEAATTAQQPSPTASYQQPQAAEAVVQNTMGVNQPNLVGTTPVHVSTLPMQASVAPTQTLLVGQPTLAAQQYAALNQPVLGMASQPPPNFSNALVPLNSAYAAANSAQNAYLQYAAAAGLQLNSAQPGAFYGQSNLVQAPQAMPPAAPAATTGNDMQSFVMLNETRQNVVELRLQVGKLTDRLEKVYEKVADTSPASAMNSYGIPANVMLETQTVLNNVQRIVAENERLKRESFDRAEKIESLNARVAELVSRNSATAERGSALLESTGERLKAEAHQQAARVLELENDRLKLVSELSEKTGALTDTRRELEDARRREAEARTRLNAALSADETRRDESSNLRAQLADITRENEEMRNRLRDERAARKQLETRAAELDETVAELRETCSSAEKQLTERKRRNLADRQRFEQVLASERAAHEAELSAAREQVRSSATALDAAEASRADAARAQLEADLRSRFEKQLLTERTRLERAVSDEREERERASKQATELADRLASTRADLAKREAELEQLAEANAQLRSINEKLERTTQRLSARANGAVERELEQALSELATLREHLDESRRERDTLVKRCRELETAVPASPAAASAADASAEVKRIMNNVFQSLRKQLDAATMYSGKDVLALMLSIIKSVTLSMLAPSATEKQSQPEQPVATLASAPPTVAVKPVSPSKSNETERPPIAASIAESPAKEHVADSAPTPAEAHGSQTPVAQVEEVSKPAPPSVVSDAAVSAAPTVNDNPSLSVEAEPVRQEESTGSDDFRRDSVESEDIVIVSRAPAPTLAEPDLVSPVVNSNAELAVPVVQAYAEAQQEASAEAQSNRSEVPVGLDVVPGGIQPGSSTVSDGLERAEHPPELDSDSEGSEDAENNSEQQPSFSSDVHENAAGPDLLRDDRGTTAAEPAVEDDSAAPQVQAAATSSKPDIMLAHPDEERESSVEENVESTSGSAPADTKAEESTNVNQSASVTTPDSDEDEEEEEVKAKPAAVEAVKAAETQQAVQSASDMKAKPKLFDDDDEDDDMLSLFAAAKPAALATRSDTDMRNQSLRPDADTASIKSDHKDAESVQSVSNSDGAVRNAGPSRSADDNSTAKKNGDDANKGKSATSSRSSLASGARGAPPPLFGDDEEDEDDLDWLKSAK